MLTVRIPNNFQEERQYIISVLLGEFLGLKYCLENHDEQYYELNINNDRKVIIKDSFFSNLREEQGYLSVINLPKKVEFCINPFIVEKNIPVIFGDNSLNIQSNEIVCGIDIFASSFFMLTRWEEYVNKERDMYNRFPATASVAYKFGFLDRPIVNEYVEMLWNMLRYLGIEQGRKQRSFQYILTHDVDHIIYWKSLKQLFRRLGGDILKRKSIREATNSLKDFINVRLGNSRDPYDTFDFLMDLSESLGVKSHFYFMSGGLTTYDNHYNIDSVRAKEIIRKIEERNHIIGFHPSFNTYNNKKQWRKEKEKLEEVLGYQVKEGRQHYLRFEAPFTWRIWNENQMEFDSTLSYADKEGFRCGVCYDFPVFDFLERRQLKLREFPLIVMEGSFTTYQNIEPFEMEKKIVSLIEKVKKYKGNFVYLWHNSSFKVGKWREYDNIYSSTLLKNHDSIEIQKETF